MALELKSQSGTSLTEVLIALAMSSMILAGMGKFLVNSKKANKHVEIQSDLESIRNRILKSLNCEKTLGVASGETITVRREFPVKDILNRLMTDDKGRVASTSIYLRAQSEPGVGLFFEYQLAKANSDGSLTPIADPLGSSKPSGYKSLFPSEPFCTEYFVPVVAAEGGGEGDPSDSLPDVSCARGRFFVGFKDKQPVCGSTDEDLRGPPTCVLLPAPPPSSGLSVSNGAAVAAGNITFAGGNETGTGKCTQGPLLPSKACSFSKATSSEGVVEYVETCQ